MSGIAELLAPSVCVECLRPARGSLCLDCAEELQPLVPPLCDRCGSPATSRRCWFCADLRGVGRARSLVAYGGPASRVTLALKRRGPRGVAAGIGGMLADLARREGLASGAVAFVPAGGRASGKGFDHAALLAAELALHLDAPLSRRLRRTGIGRRQADAPASERRSNAAHAFVARPVRGRILLVDDVLTTGATIEACALALLGAGAECVDAVTWARTLRRTPRRRGGGDILGG